MKIKKRRISMLFLSLVFVAIIFSRPTIVSARNEESAGVPSDGEDYKSWTSETDSSSTKVEWTPDWREKLEEAKAEASENNIYGEGTGLDIADNDDEQEEPSMVEELFIGMFKAMATGLSWVLEPLGVSLDSVIMGRVGGGGVNLDGTRVSLFTFELKPSNPYGLVGAAVYSMIRNIMYVIIACMFLSKVAMAAWKGGKEKGFAALKETIADVLLAFSMLTLMPYLVDIMLYIRDVMLYAVGITGVSDVLGVDIATDGLIGIFASHADESIISAAMYFGVEVLSVWFAFQYVGLALTNVVYFFAFPFVAAMMQVDKKILGNWWKEMLSNALIPLADVTLLMIPAGFGAFAGSASDSLPIATVQILVCSMIIPARTALRQAMGLSGKTGLELAGLATLRGAGAFAGAAVKSAAGLIGGVAGGISAARSDSEMGDMYSEMGRNQKSTDNALSDMYNQKNGWGVETSEDGIKSAGKFERNGFDSKAEAAKAIEQRNGLMPGTIDDGQSSDAISEGLISPSQVGTTDAGAGSSFGSGRGVSLAQSMQKQEDNRESAILGKYANIKNFDNPEFRNLSYEDKAKLYKKRAGKQLRDTMTRSIGKTAGGIAGAAAGFGAGMFLSPGTKMTLMGAGIGVGDAIGGVVGENLGDFAQAKIDNRIQRAEGSHAEETDDMQESIPVVGIGNLGAPSGGVPIPEAHQMSSPSPSPTSSANANTPPGNASPDIGVQNLEALSANGVLNSLGQSCADYNGDTSVNTAYNGFYNEVMGDTSLNNESERIGKFREKAKDYSLNKFMNGVDAQCGVNDAHTFDEAATQRREQYKVTRSSILEKNSLSNDAIRKMNPNWSFKKHGEA